MDEDEINCIERDLFMLATVNGEKELLKKMRFLFEYIRLLKKENELKKDKLIKLYEDNMILHKEIVLLLENKDK